MMITPSEKRYAQPGTYVGTIEEASIIEKAGEDRLRLRWMLQDDSGACWWTEIIPIRETLAWRLNALCSAVQLPAMDLVDFVPALIGRSCRVTLTQRGEWLSARHAKLELTRPATADEEPTDEIPF